MTCCINCFNDSFLKTIIIQKSANFGNCDFCKTKNINIISPQKLNDEFQPLLDLYEETISSGKTIFQLLKEDWALFLSLDENSASQLIEMISDTKFDQLYASKKSDNFENIINWQDFKNELKHNNRYFPKKAPSYSHLKGLLQYILKKDNIPKYLYRSRINNDNEIIDITKMGKPPEKISSAGRANPIGIPYLYTASNCNTAIAEIRPHKGDSITVATFEVIAPLVLADLRNPRETISPFGLDENGLNQIFIDLDYLCHLGEELSKPILPREANLEYLSSQYLCELIKDCGFDGVIYKSSVGNGDNYAFFNEEKLKAINTKLYIVDSVIIESSQK